VLAVVLDKFVNQQHLIALFFLINVLAVLERLQLEPGLKLLLVHHVHQQMVEYRTRNHVCAHLVLDVTQAVDLFATEVLPHRAVMHLLVYTLMV